MFTLLVKGWKVSDQWEEGKEILKYGSRRGASVKWFT